MNLLRRPEGYPPQKPRPVRPRITLAEARKRALRMLDRVEAARREERAAEIRRLLEEEQECR